MDSPTEELGKYVIKLYDNGMEVTGRNDIRLVACLQELMPYVHKEFGIDVHRPGFDLDLPYYNKVERLMYEKQHIGNAGTEFLAIMHHLKDSGITGIVTIEDI